MALRADHARPQQRRQQTVQLRILAHCRRVVLAQIQLCILQEANEQQVRSVARSTMGGSEAGPRSLNWPWKRTYSTAPSANTTTGAQ